MLISDETEVINGGLPEKWTCPHCHKRQRFSSEAENILLEFGKYIEHCENCGYVHLWKLKLTEEFKKKVIKMLLGEERKIDKYVGR
jgi:rubredoxin